MHIRFISFGLFLLITPLGLLAENPTDSLKDRLEKLAVAQEFDSFEIESICEECVRTPNPAYYPALTKLLDRSIKLEQKANLNNETHIDITPLVSALCELDGRKGYAAATRRYGALSVNSELQSTYLDALLPYACKLQIEDVLKKKDQIQVNFPVDSAAVPDALSDLPADLLDAWRYYKNATTPYERYKKQMADKKSIDVNHNWPQFYKVMQETLTQPKVDTLSCIMSFEYGGFCGTGSESLYVPQSRAVLLSLVKNGRFAESIGAALELDESQRRSLYSYRNDREFKWQKQLIEFVGLDWEKLYLGASLGGTWFDSGYLSKLASHGGEKSALQMAQMAPVFRKHEFRFPGYLGSLATMMKRKKTISRETRQKLLDLIHKSVHADTAPSEIEAAVTTLAELKRPESIPVLKRAAKLPNYLVAKTAATALRDMGVSVPLPTPPKPVSFLLSHNGQPLKKEKVDYELIGIEGRNLSSSMTTDDQGRLSLEGEDFIDLKRPIKRVQFKSGTLRHLGQIVFFTSVEPPFDRENDTKIQIRTHVLTVTLNNMPDPKAIKGQSMFLKLEYLKPLQSVDEVQYYGQRGRFTLITSSACIFPRLGDGRYKLTVDIPGRAHWESEEIVMDQDREQVIDLKPGADMYFKILAPGGELADNRVVYQLKGSKDYSQRTYSSYQTGSFRGLPEGKYKLKILSSKEKRASMWGRQSTAPKHCSSQFDYSGKEIPFTISEELPLVDLGTIRLLPIDDK